MHGIGKITLEKCINLVNTLTKQLEYEERHHDESYPNTIKKLKQIKKRLIEIKSTEEY